MNDNDQVKNAQVLESYLRSRLPWWTKLSKVCAFVLFVAILIYIMAMRLDAFERIDRTGDIIVIIFASILCAIMGNQQ